MVTQSDLILVAGATGGVGQLAVAKLLEKNLSVRIPTRNRSKAEQMFDNQVELVVGDLRYPDTLLKAKTDGKKAVVIGTGDNLNGDTSRIDVANVCVECLNYDITINQALDIINSGERPELIDWQKLFHEIS